MMPRRRKEEKSRNLRDSVEVTIFYPSKTVECLTIFGSRLNLVLSIVISNTCIFYAANDRRCLGIVLISRLGLRHQHGPWPGYSGLCQRRQLHVVLLNMLRGSRELSHALF